MRTRPCGPRCVLVLIDDLDTRAVDVIAGQQLRRLPLGPNGNYLAKSKKPRPTVWVRALPVSYL